MPICMGGDVEFFIENEEKDIVGSDLLLPKKGLDSNWVDDTVLSRDGGPLVPSV